MARDEDDDVFVTIKRNTWHNGEAARRRRNTKTRKGDKEHRQAGAAEEDLGQEDRDKKREELGR